MWGPCLISYLAALTVLYARAQTIVDEEECKIKSLTCPREHDPSYAKYCCATSAGLLSCCNPYLSLGLGLGIPLVVIVLLCASFVPSHHAHPPSLNHSLSLGLGLGIPLVVIVLVIVFVVVLVCVLIRCNRAKMYANSVAYNRVVEETAAAVDTAPPSYDQAQEPPPVYSAKDGHAPPGQPTSTNVL